MRRTLGEDLHQMPLALIKTELTLDDIGSTAAAERFSGILKYFTPEAFARHFKKEYLH